MKKIIVLLLLLLALVILVGCEDAGILDDKVGQTSYKSDVYYVVVENSFQGTTFETVSKFTVIGPGFSGEPILNRHILEVRLYESGALRVIFRNSWYDDGRFRYKDIWIVSYTVFYWSI